MPFDNNNFTLLDILIKNSETIKIHFPNCVY